MKAQVRSCGSSAWSTDAGVVFETNWLSGSSPVYDVQKPRLRTEADSVAPWAPNRAEYCEGRSYDSDSSRNLMYEASRMVKSSLEQL